MKKYIVFIIICLSIIFGLIYVTYGKEILTLLNEKKVYSVKNTQVSKINTLDEYMFFSGGIITYNNKKAVFLKYNNDIVWENEDTEFANQVFVTDKYLFRKIENTIQLIDKNNQKHIMTEIKGDLINVSRENNKTYMILKNEDGLNSVYIINDNNDIIVEDKKFDDMITGISISDKSEGYTLTTLRFENGIMINTVYSNLFDDVELWETTIKDEIIVKIQSVNNNVIAIGTKNIYYYNINGKLMWKNNIFNKIIDYHINNEEQTIYILFEKDNYNELITYNFQGKILEIYKAPDNVKNLKVYDNKIFVYSDSNIYLLHNSKADKIYEEMGIFDFEIVGKEINILFKDKLIKGQINWTSNIGDKGGIRIKWTILMQLCYSS